MDDCFLRQTPYSDPGDGVDAAALPPRSAPAHRAGARPAPAPPAGSGSGTPSVRRLHHDAASRYVTEIPRILSERGSGPLTEEELDLLETVAAAGTVEERRRLPAGPRPAVPGEIESRTTFPGSRAVTLPEPSARPV
ncbi:hypothetical protein [Streptomyces sp. NPDC001135]